MDAADVDAALHVDLKNDGATLVHEALCLGAQRPVAVPVHVGPLQELAGRHAAVELVFGEEVVGGALHLALPGCPRSGRDRQAQARLLLAQTRDQGALAHT